MTAAAPDPRDRFFDVAGLEKGLGARTGRSAVTVLVYSGVKLGLTLGTTAVLARLVPPAEHGLLAFAIPAVLIATGLSEFGLAQAVTQRPEVTHALASALFWVNVALGGALTAAVFLAGYWAAGFYDAPEVTAVFQILSPYVFLAVLTTQYMALLRRQMRVRTIERCGTAAMVASAAVAMAMAAMGYGVGALMAQLLVLQGLTFAFLALATGWVPSGPRTLLREPLGEVLTYGGFLAAERLLNDLSRNVRLGLVGRLFGPVEAGLYYRAEAISNMPQRRVLSPLSAAFIPSLSRLQDDPAGLSAMLRRQISRSNLIVIPAGAALAGAADLFVELLLGPDWGAAAPILALLGVFCTTVAAQSCMAWALVATGQSRPLFVFRLVNTAVILAGVLGAAALGAGVVGVTLAHVVTAAGFGLLHLAWWVRRVTPVRRADVAASLADTVGLSALLLGGALAVRWAFDLAPWLEAGLALGAVGLLTALAGLGRAETRADILKLARRRGGPPSTIAPSAAPAAPATNRETRP